MEGDEIGGVEVRSAAMRRVVQQCRLYAEFDCPVTLIGPVGSGKTMLAGVLYNAARLPGRLTAITGGGTPPDLFHGALFGAIPGAFTDARKLSGLLEAAAGGMLFFDDVAQMPVVTQAALLRVLDAGRFRPLGEAEEREVTCRFVFATTDEPRALVADGRMLRDFASRLGEFVIEVPPLLERREEILPMAHRFATEFVHKQGRDSTIRVVEDAATALLAYAWPGNLRELKNVMERAVVHALKPGDVTTIRRAHLPERILTLGSARPVAEGPLDPVVLDQTLRKFDGNQSAAARELGVHRNTVRKYRLRARPEPG